MERATSKLRSTPLRIKLVAAVLVLVFAALTLMSVSSTFALRTYLVGRMDDELAAVIGEMAHDLEYYGEIHPEGNLPSEYMYSVRSVSGVGTSHTNIPSLRTADLPPYFTKLSDINERIGAQPYTAISPNKQVHWRMMIAVTDQGAILYVGRNMAEVESAVTRLIWIDALVGGAVLVGIAAAGAAIVRTSLRPLVEIEQTAGAIAAGDLTRRVPDPEPGSEYPHTELGRLSRALNAMLAQIEAAFTARAHSEAAARAAESAARDAAEAARSSETRAVRSEEKMRQFVADASHELRTPLTSIRGYAELYRQGAVAEADDVARLVRRIEDEASRMGLLVEDLLLLARLDRERPLNLAPVELPVLAMDAVEAASATAPGRTIDLDVRDTPERLVAYGDDARLRQVLGNLVTNALVHTPPEASVTVRLSAASGERAVVEVVDTGPGLSPEQRDRVFERFYRVDGARTRRTDRQDTGTGLGLAIVAAIVRAHHGNVEVVSEPGQGATFRVSLPTVVASDPADA
ncbi:sensor histidine kinase [Mangrovihabitans endophyticus]|uniref:histidine kinase n=1 Tax=Mangrovihabitans endophyticus TaxID=1751298 RepID=A0A8J3C2N3_9ACTN|nr:HAMP domain-containing sensor histidine kinase [Mangrovihabitans endophyticus]GGL01341.1 two-component sensor histidine kinase [Mangrovihabitans endophyticus]